MTNTSKVESSKEEVHPYSVNARKRLNQLIAQHDVKAEWLAMRCHVTPQAMGHYRSGDRPIPMHVGALIDEALGGHEMLLCMANMEGIQALGAGEAAC